MKDMIVERQKRVKQALRGKIIDTPLETYQVFKIEAIDFDRMQAWCLCVLQPDNKYIKRWVSFD